MAHILWSNTGGWSFWENWSNISVNTEENVICTLYSHRSKSKAGCKLAQRKAWQLEHLSISHSTVTQPYFAQTSGDSSEGLPAHFREYSCQEKQCRKYIKMSKSEIKTLTHSFIYTGINRLREKATRKVWKTIFKAHILHRIMEVIWIITGGGEIMNFLSTKPCVFYMTEIWEFGNIPVSAREGLKARKQNLDINVKRAPSWAGSLPKKIVSK